MNSNSVTHGLKNNWIPFTLLVVVNGFVGSLVGLERSIFPEFAQQEFGLTSSSAILSFIIAFGISKAIANYFTGKFSNKIGRKNLLVLGWLVALPIPFMLIHAPTWNWVIFANILLGINQGLCWSSTVVMKIDLVGQKDRGLAMGINEFSGYLAVGVMAFVSSVIAQHYGVTPYPFYLGLLLTVVGLILSLFFVKDTRVFVETEQLVSKEKSHSNVFVATSFKNKSLSAITQAGLVNNLNDGMIWGLLPLFLAGLSFDIETIGIIAAVYPTTWGVCQLFTGKMGDHFSKKKLLFLGMLLQGIVIITLPWLSSVNGLIALAAVLGFGTALVYPNFLSAIADVTNPIQRAESIGVFRLWRDLGYAFGAIISGLVADWFGIAYAIVFIGCITLLSALVIQIRMPKPSQ